MGCLSVIVRRIGGIVSGMTRVFGDITGTATRICDTEVSITRVGGIDASARRVGGMTCRMGLVCSTGVGIGIIWASDGRLITLEGGFLIAAD